MNATANDRTDAERAAAELNEGFREVTRLLDVMHEIGRGDRESLEMVRVYQNAALAVLRAGLKDLGDLHNG